MGAIWFVGSVSVLELLGLRQSGLRLAWSDAGVLPLSLIKEHSSAEVHRGNFKDLGSLLGRTASVDNALHLALNHDFSKFVENYKTDIGTPSRRSAERSKNPDRPLLVSSGLALLAPGLLILTNKVISRAE